MESGIHKLYRQDKQPFAMIPNSAIRNPNLSASAFRLLAYLYSHQDGFEIPYWKIENDIAMKRYAINQAIINLESLGYIRVDRPKLPNGQFGAKSWTLLDPEASVGNSTMESPHMEPLPSGEINGHIENNLTKKTTVKEKHLEEKPTRATKISEDFEVTQDMRKWSLDNLITIDIDVETKKFIAYYQATDKPMKNWVAAWRNWILKAQDFQKPVWEKLAQKKEFDSRSSSDSSKRATKEFIAESQKASEAAAPPPKCEHGKSLVSCIPCLRKLS